MLTVLGEAERFGAVVLNRAEVTEVLDEEGPADGVAFREAESGARIELRADNVVNATGVWADRIRPEELLAEEEIPRIRPSRGTHVTLSTEQLDIGTAACIVPAAGERTIFALPWYGRVLVGTTDNDYEGTIDHVPPSGDDVEYLLDAVNAYFGTDVGPDDLTGAYAGVRPLVSSGDPKKSVDISRRAELYETSSGMLTITGGKLTTFRRMAAQVVDRITQRDGRDAESRTDDIPLGMAARPDDLETSVGLPDGAIDQLAFRYGHAARAVLDLCEQRPELARADRPGPPRSARGGCDRSAARAGALGRRRPLAAHATRPGGGPRAPRPGRHARGGAAPGGGARLERIESRRRAGGLGTRWPRREGLDPAPHPDAVARRA